MRRWCGRGSVSQAQCACDTLMWILERELFKLGRYRVGIKELDVDWCVCGSVDVRVEREIQIGQEGNINITIKRWHVGIGRRAVIISLVYVGLVHIQSGYNYQFNLCWLRAIHDHIWRYVNQTSAIQWMNEFPEAGAHSQDICKSVSPRAPRSTVIMLIR